MRGPKRLSAKWKPQTKKDKDMQMRIDRKQAIELGLCDWDQIWFKGKAYLGDSEFTYDDYLKDGGRQLEHLEAMQLGLVPRGYWFKGKVYFGESGLSYEDYLAAGGPQFNKAQAVEFGLCNKHEPWLGGEVREIEQPIYVKYQGKTISLLNYIKLKDFKIPTLDLSKRNGPIQLPKDKLTVTGNMDISYTAITRLPNHLVVHDTLNVSHCKDLKTMPKHLEARYFVMVNSPVQKVSLEQGDIEIKNCSELVSLQFKGYRLSNIQLMTCPSLTSMPEDILCFKLHLNNTGITELHKIVANHDIILDNNKKLRTIHGPIISESTISLKGTALVTLPAGTKAHHDIDLRECKSLKSLPDDLECRRLFLPKHFDKNSLPKSLLERIKIIVQE
jgi:hypothetical protein